jgi:hypothetical protein
MSKQLIGVNLGSYTFDATNKQVTLSGIDPLTLDQILLITNVTTNTIIYNFADPTLGGSIAANVVTLTYDTISMNNTDILQVFVEYPDAAQPTAFSITGPSGFVADVTNSNQLKVSTPPPTPPAASNPIGNEVFSVVSAVEDTFSIPLTNAKTATITRLTVSVEPVNNGTSIELFEDIDGDGLNLRRFARADLNGDFGFIDLLETIVGDGIKRILMRVEPKGGGAREVFRRWEGFEE